MIKKLAKVILLYISYISFGYCAPEPSISCEPNSYAYLNSCNIGYIGPDCKSCPVEYPNSVEASYSLGGANTENLSDEVCIVTETNDCSDVCRVINAPTIYDCWKKCNGTGDVINIPNGKKISKEKAYYGEECGYDFICDEGYELVDENCVSTSLCESGISQIKTSNGLSFVLYAEKRTNPSLHVKYNGKICYADLVRGQSSNSINIHYDGSLYHIE